MTASQARQNLAADLRRAAIFSPPVPVLRRDALRIVAKLA